MAIKSNSKQNLTYEYGVSNWHSIYVHTTKYLMEGGKEVELFHNMVRLYKYQEKEYADKIRIG